jgi:hypothetical protein
MPFQPAWATRENQSVRWDQGIRGVYANFFGEHARFLKGGLRKVAGDRQISDLKFLADRGR